MRIVGGRRAAGTQLVVRLSEELLCDGCNPAHAGGGGANSGKGCNTCDFNETRKVARGESVIFK
jgi:hypothetical protein